MQLLYDAIAFWCFIDRFRLEHFECCSFVYPSDTLNLVDHQNVRAWNTILILCSVLRESVFFIRFVPSKSISIFV